MVLAGLVASFLALLLFFFFKRFGGAISGISCYSASLSGRKLPGQFSVARRAHAMKPAQLTLVEGQSFSDRSNLQGDFLNLHYRINILK